MNRYLPVARQHFLGALASTSVVVKSISAVVLLLYLLSWAVDTAYALGVTPGYLFPPNFWVWTLATHGVVEVHIWGVAASIGTVMACGRLLEPLWGALELLIFFAVVNVSAGVLAGLSYLLTYVATFDLGFLFAVRVHGAAAFLGGVLVALKQTMGDTTVLRVPQVSRRSNREDGTQKSETVFHQTICLADPLCTLYALLLLLHDSVVRRVFVLPTS